MLVFTGGYTQDIPMASGEVVPGRSGGIACWRLEEETGRLELLRVTASTPNPSYLAADPEGAYLYCVNELEEVGGVPGSTVSAYAVDPESGALRLLGRQMAAGPLACHIVLSPNGGHLLAASYNGGICVLPAGEDHALRMASCAWSFRGRGIDPDRQEMPHPHQILLHPDGEHVYACDLGTDRLRRFRADWAQDRLLPEEEGDLSARPGQGPRHGVFDRQGRRLYVLTELTSQMDVFDPETGELLQVRSALPEGWTGLGMGAAVRLHPGGRFLYASLRGPHCIAAFPVQAGGTLGAPAFYPSGGRTPRDFCLMPDGRWLLAGGQDDGSICVHRIDPSTGRLEQVWRAEDAGSVTALTVWDAAR